MDTSAINYRVADFLRKHPPFQAMEEADLLGLAAHGRVRFHEANEYILWQGEPHKLHVFVIQHGTVSLWDEAEGEPALRDVRGAGDMLGVERFTGAPHCLYSARSVSDVVIYGFPASDFEDHVLTYPYARQFVEAYDSVTADYQRAKDAHDPQTLFLHDMVGRSQTCGADATIRDVAQSMLAAGSDAIAVVDEDARVLRAVTISSLLAWVATGAGTADQPITALPGGAPPAVGAVASVIDGVLAMAEADAEALAVTSDGSPAGRLHSLVTSTDVARAFGDPPASILRQIRLAPNTKALRELNHRARALALRHLTSAGAVDWLARFVSIVDTSIVKRLVALTGGEPSPACWCFSGVSGRGESLTRHSPQLMLVVADEADGLAWQGRYQRVCDALTDCDYLARAETTFDRSFHVASRATWQTRYEHWLRDPVRSEMYRARYLFDLRPVHGDVAPWRDLEAAVVAAIDRDFLQVLANDCLASLPPLTFYEDAVVEKSGEHATIFRLDESALQPLVDVGRVFGMAAKQLLGTSTLDRFGCARTMLPDHASIFREASDTLRILLWQQARIGIDQGTSGSELPPTLLSRYDRHALKSGFRSIHRLLEFTGNTSWLAGV